MGNLEAQLEGFAAGALWFYGALLILEALLELREIPTLQGLRARLGVLLRPRVGRRTERVSPPGRYRPTGC